jgi:hypothetical protein
VLKNWPSEFTLENLERKRNEQKKKNGNGQKKSINSLVFVKPINCHQSNSPLVKMEAWHVNGNLLDH